MLSMLLSLRMRLWTVREEGGAGKREDGIGTRERMERGSKEGPTLEVDVVFVRYAQDVVSLVGLHRLQQVAL